MKWILTLTILVCQSTLWAQQGMVLISGTVIDQQTKQPLPNASVFAQHTTMGTYCNSEGKFNIYLPPGGYELAISFTGYQTEMQRISTSDLNLSTVTIELKRKEKELETVAVIATTEVKDGWLRYGNFFTDQFIGTSPNSKNCTIKNPEILKFYFSKKKNRLKVLASEPLKIENKALGYEIKYALDSFTYAYETQQALYTGYPLFENMQSSNSIEQEQWKQARALAYQGSILHFMRTVYMQELKEQGFEIQFLASYKSASEIKDTALRLKNAYTAMNYEKDSLGVVWIKPNQQRLGVIYNQEKPSALYLEKSNSTFKEFQFSILQFPSNEHIAIEQNGYYFEQQDLSISEYWSWEKVADQLPYDYYP